MSINPLLTNYGPGASLYAPSGGGGGGGGGSDNPVVSSITFTGGAPTVDIAFPAGYEAQCTADVFQFEPIANAQGVIIDTVGCNTVTSNCGLIISDFNSAANLQITQGTTASITPQGTPGNYIGIGTCIPQMYRAQFVDSGVPVANPMATVGEITATAVGGMNVLNGAGAGWIFNMSSLNVSSINNGPSIATLFANLFAANPTLSTIVY